MNHQLEVWAFPGQPLREVDWQQLGFNTLLEYLESLITSHEGHREGDCKRCFDVKGYPFVSFGSYDPKTNEKTVLAECATKEDLPTESIPGVLEFNTVL